MTSTTYQCDRCGRPAAEGRIRLVLAVGAMAGVPIDQGSGRPTMDLCGACADELAKWFKIERSDPSVHPSLP